MSILILRFPIPDSRFPIPDLPTHDSRLTIHLGMVMRDGSARKRFG